MCIVSPGGDKRAVRGEDAPHSGAQKLYEVSDLLYEVSDFVQFMFFRDYVPKSLLSAISQDADIKFIRYTLTHI